MGGEVRMEGRTYEKGREENERERKWTRMRGMGGEGVRSMERRGFSPVICFSTPNFSLIGIPPNLNLGSTMLGSQTIQIS